MFSYSYEGEQYCFTIPARTREEAIERVRRLPWANYDGVVAMTIPLGPESLWRRIFRLCGAG